MLGPLPLLLFLNKKYNGYLISKKKNIINVLKGFSYDGNLESVEYLISKFNIIDNNVYDELLVWAIEGEQLHVVKYFVEKGANIHHNNEFALIWSVLVENFEIADYLVAQGANVNTAIEECKKGNTELIDILKMYISKELCGICLIEMDNNLQQNIRCDTCKKFIHNNCNYWWRKIHDSCIYCRS